MNKELRNPRFSLYTAHHQFATSCKLASVIFFFKEVSCSINKWPEIEGNYMVWTLVFLQNSYAEILMPNVMVPRWGTFERCLGYKRWLGHEWDPREIPIPSAMLEYEEKSTNRKVPSPDHPGTLILDFHSLELWKINFCFFIRSSVYGILL